MILGVVGPTTRIVSAARDPNPNSNPPPPPSIHTSNARGMGSSVKALGCSIKQRNTPIAEARMVPRIVCGRVKR